MEENLPPQESAEPKVSAILVGYNQATELRRAIQALDRSADSERLEILLVDCGSHDESSQLDAEFPRITMLRLPHHLGATRAMNIATRTAKGEYVFYLSPEVEVAQDAVARLAERLDAEADVIAACPLLVDPVGSPVPQAGRIPSRETFAIICRGGQPPSVAIDLEQDSVDVEYPGRDAILVRKQFVKGMNYFDERFGEYWADADLAAQIRRSHRKIRIYPGVRATIHATTQGAPRDTSLTADCILGASAFLGKYEGLLAGLGFRLSAILGALLRFDLRQFGALVGGRKLDGSQAG